MTEEERSQIAFRWCLMCIVIWHCRHQQARQKIQHALYYLRDKGVVKRVGKDRWVAA
jgi:hypothetical protein